MEKLTDRQTKVLAILSDGGKHSVAELTAKTFFCDIRTYIQVLRKKGYKIADEWRNGDDERVRFKVYYLDRSTPADGDASDPNNFQSANDEETIYRIR